MSASLSLENGTPVKEAEKAMANPTNGNGGGSFNRLRDECRQAVQTVCNSLAERLPPGLTPSNLAAMQAAVLADFDAYLASAGSIEAGCAQLDEANARAPADGRLAWRPPLHLAGADRSYSVIRDATYADLLAYHGWLRQQCASLIAECRDERARLRAELARADASVIELEAHAEVLKCLAESAEQQSPGDSKL